MAQFSVWRQLVGIQLSIYQQKTRQQEEEIVAVRSQKAAAIRQLDLVKTEMDVQERLVKQGYSARTELIILQQKAAELEGNIGAYAATISKLEQAIAETRMDSLNFKNQKITEVASELQTVQVSIADMEERIKAAENTLERTKIVAPEDGIATGLKVHTVGGVIAPGTAIVDIVPRREELIVECRIRPEDIDVVHEGLPARVRLSAYRSRKAPLLLGKVVHVSPDRFNDPVSSQPFFLARVRLNSDQLLRLRKVALCAGMGAEVYIVTGSRSFLAYFLTPLEESLHRSFRED